MRVLLISFFSLCLLGSCQPGIDDVLPQPNDTTDTSKIARVTKICHNCAGDSIVHIYKNNTLSGVKGYIINSRESFTNTSYIAKFSYNNEGHIKKVIQEYSGPAGNGSITWDFTWNSVLLKNIKYNEDGLYFMDRTYDYQNSHDTLFIRGTARHLDSTTYYTDFTFLTDTGCNRPLGIYNVGSFPDFAGGYDFYRQSFYEYTAGNIVKKTDYEEIVGHSGAPFGHRKDSTITKYPRLMQASDFWSDLERKVLGKELRMLAYVHDTTNFLFDDYFQFTNNYELGVLENERQPASSIITSKTVYTDGVITTQFENKTTASFTYTFDSLNRIKTVKAFDPVSSQLLFETIIDYY